MMTKQIVIIFYITTLSVTMAGCAASTDPHTGGFIGGLKGIYSGEYDKRIQQRQDELSMQKEETNRLQVEHDARESEYQSKVKALASEQERMEEMNKFIASLTSDIARINVKSARQGTKIATLKTNIRRLQLDINNSKADGKYMVDPEHYRMLEKKRDNLAKEYKALLVYFNSLSDVN